MGISCFSPIFVTISVLHFTNDALTTLLSLQAISYLLIPYLYINYLSKEGEISPYFMNEFQNRMYQIKSGVSLFASAFGLVVVSYIILFEFRHKLLMIISIPIKYNFIYIFLFFIFYGIINPVLEEWFWRIFVPKTYPNS